MERFAALIDGLVYTRSRNGKLALIADYTPARGAWHQTIVSRRSRGQRKGRPRAGPPFFRFRPVSPAQAASLRNTYCRMPPFRK